MKLHTATASDRWVGNNSGSDMHVLYSLPKGKTTFFKRKQKFDFFQFHHSQSLKQRFTQICLILKLSLN